MVATEWIGVDWGTTHTRAWAFAADGSVIAHGESDKGMGKLKPEEFEPALLELIEPWLAAGGVTRVLACGMIGARQGWVEAPYVAAPCAPPGVAQAIQAKVSDPRLSVLILPGVSQDKPADVMRGEETQIAGFLATHPDFSGTVCLPGTHAKWAYLENDGIREFRTIMTGEIFAALEQNTVLRFSLERGHDEAAFLQGVNDVFAVPDSFVAHLFALRAEGLLHGLGAVEAYSRLSGLVIGAELASVQGLWAGSEVALVGGGALTQLYAKALAAKGVATEIVSGDEMVIAGLRRAWDEYVKGMSV